MLNKIAVIGDKDSVLAFSAVGADVFDANSADTARELVRELSAKGYAVILITEQLAEIISDTLMRAKAKPFPAIVPIPSAKGSTGFGIAGIKKDVEKAIGTDIIFNKED
jgi:V/A-type H+-transporting ATPase subunit F